MPRKIYDVKPPKVAKKVEKEIKEFLVEKKKPRRVTRSVTTPTVAPITTTTNDITAKRYMVEKKHSILKPVFIAGAVVVIILAVVLFIKLPKADIKIWPKVEVLSFKQTLSAEKSATTMDEEKAIIPAYYFEQEQSGSQEFQATGSASDAGKATGTITIYNKADPVAPMTLKAGTHFLSDSGKYFVTLEKVVVPAGKKSGGKVTPGSVEAKVEAAEGGASFNIAPAKFSVPKLSGSNYYYTTYAESTKEMTGGFDGKIKKVTTDDIADAEDVVVKKLTEDAVSAIKSKITEEYVLLDDAVSSEVLNATSSAQSGTVADKFTEDAKIKISALAFKKADAENFVKKYILSQTPGGKDVLDSSLKVSYSVKSADFKTGKISVDLDFSSGVYQDINVNSLSLLLTGRNPSQIEETVKNNLGEGVEKTEVKLWPFWVKKSPNNQKAVNVELKFE